MNSTSGPILPGATIGMVGGGQLGRMFAIAAAKLGYRVGVFCGSSDEPAADVASFTVCGPLEDHSAIENFARRCDVITLEFENIPAETIAVCGQHAPTYPDASVLATAQDRLLEKTTLRDAGLPVTPFAPVRDAQQTCAAADSLGWPLIVKTQRSGYDGKGQHRLADAAEAERVDWQGGGDWVAEAMIDLQREVSVIVARRADGVMDTFPVFENTHRNHVLDVTTLPAAISPDMQQQACDLAIAAAECLDVVGLLCVEMFIENAGNGEPRILINEVAPRPHNSGHVSMEACRTSQFEQHVRAICGLPLGDTAQITPAAAMVNLLGDWWGSQGEQPNWPAALDVHGVSLHLYGKHAARPGRKMGHLTAVGETLDEVTARLERARDSLRNHQS
ncbi:5-(carboxyamino)imidazole ribonucleotide synthase [Allorhodopirellula heiligendammensis]|uniref:N5-carboxyaminoimidazole ribonucleotide synthase n=1 Tax=Allorhodopirellula heiligendammensis TaxID=2714739 RepID=A0A5C6C9A3_9BACT|nr:5-(carboxyamino)imidazole ribonucleotide synthase [Allorhodopirellula heiligendammensis]TWU20031.1 N5-carboxyaminoimidazole ribonucleotide synthase [Allorhodopirellula heiligendammensis]